MIERLHRYFLDVVKTELDCLGRMDINSMQAMILFNIGKEELTVGELTSRGYYLGSNVTYNVQKMVENKYLLHERCPYDRRSIRVRLSEKGLGLYDEMKAMFERHIECLDAAPASNEEMRITVKSLRNLEEFWSHLLRLGQRSATNAAAG